jgi:hypothetical protein
LSLELEQYKFPEESKAKPCGPVNPVDKNVLFVLLKLCKILELESVKL